MNAGDLIQLIGFVSGIAALAWKASDELVRAWRRRQAGRLTPAQRRRLAKFLYWQGWTFAQIARHMKVSEADVAAWRGDDDWGDQRRGRRNG